MRVWPPISATVTSNRAVSTRRRRQPMHPWSEHGWRLAVAIGVPGLDDEDEWAAVLLSRWPVLSDDFVRGPPSAEARESA